MQDLLNFVYERCRKWRLKINFSKTNVMHFRNKDRICSHFEFKIGSEVLSILLFIDISEFILMKI